jgi:putative flippase GtrA
MEGIMEAIAGMLRKNFLSEKFVRYVVNMVITYPLLIGLTFGLTEFAGMYYLLAYVLSLCVTIIINFFLSMRWIFNVEGRVGNRFVRYLVVLAAFSLANTLLVKVFTEYLGVYYLLSIILVSGSMFLLKYLTYNSKVFGRMD